MGNYTSKFFNYNGYGGGANNDGKTRETRCGEKLFTPPINKRKILTIDPRSASIGIDRTPIEVDKSERVASPLQGEVASALPKYLQQTQQKVKRYLETDFDEFEPESTDSSAVELPDPRSPNYSQQRTPIVVKPRAGPSMLDPRSPAIDFDRTPILRPKTCEIGSKNSGDEVPVEKMEKEKIFARCETIDEHEIPEISAISGPASPETPEIGENRSNVSSDGWESLNEDSRDFSSEQITVIPKIPVEKSPEAEKKFENLNFPAKTAPIGEQQKSANNDRIKVWRDSISPLARPKIPKKTEEIMIEFDDETSKNFAKPEVDRTKGKKPRSAENRPEERKIFANDAASGNPLVDPSRTPLGNRSNNRTTQLKSAKTPPAQFLRKGLTIQQENTPPADRLKNLGIHWDPDSTVII